MSYSGSQQQFGLSDLQLLQQHAMLNRLQEFQKQQQLGQLGDVKPHTSVNHLSLFGKQASGAQVPNISNGAAFSGSQMFASSNMNWMHPNVSSPMQGFSSGQSYLFDQGLMRNLSLQQPDASLYGTPVASGRGGSLGQYSPLQGVSHSSVSMLSFNSEQKPTTQVSPFANSYLEDNHSVMLRHGMQGKGSVGQGGVEMLNSGFTSPQENSVQNSSVLGNYGKHGFTGFLEETTKQTSDSRGTSNLDPLEEKILFDTESGWDSSLSKLAALGTEDYLSTSGHTEPMTAVPSIQSGSWSALMQSAVAESSSSDTGVQEELSGLSFQNTELSTNNQPSNFVTSEKQQFKWKSIPVGGQGNSAAGQTNQKPKINGQVQNMSLQENCWQADVLQGSRSSAFLMSRSSTNSYEPSQHKSSGHLCMPTGDVAVDKDNERAGYDGNHPSSSPMSIDAPNRNSLKMFESQSCFRGENSSDSYNSKVSQAYTSQPDHTRLNAEDSESSARSNHKLPQQALCMILPGENSQQGCFNNLQSTNSNAFHTNTNSMVKGELGLSSDAVSKGSPACHVSTSLNSQYTSELNKAKPPMDFGSTERFGSVLSQSDSRELDVANVSISEGINAPDMFSFQSSMLGGLKHGSLRNGVNGQTWWMPSSFGHSASPLQGQSLAQNWSGQSCISNESGFEISNLNAERSSGGAVFSGPLHARNQLKGKNTSNASVASESIQERCPGMSQEVPLSGSSQHTYPLKSHISSGFQYSTSGALPTSQSFIPSMYQQGLTPPNVWMNVSGPRDVMSSIPSELRRTDRSSLVGQNSGNSQTEVFGEEHLGKESCHEQTAPTTQTTCISGSTNQQDHFKTEPVQELVSSISAANIAGADMTKDLTSSNAVSNLNVHQASEVPLQQPAPEVPMMASNPAGRQFNAASLPALQYIHSHKIPMFGQSNLEGHSNGNDVVSDKIKDLHFRAQVAPFMYNQHGYIRNDQMLSPSVSAVLSSVTPRVNAIDGRTGLFLSPANQVVTTEQLLQSSLLPPNTVSIDPAFSNSKKRKTAMYECQPWNREVKQSCQGLRECSIAEEEWAGATNRLIEKRVDEGQSNEEMRPVVRRRKRLIFTTQLMQQVFRPPPGTILSGYAATEYEIMAYSVARLALADACSLANKLMAACHISHESGSINAARLRNPWSTGHPSRAIAIAELVEKTQKLESYIDGLDKSLSIVDVRVECQELEKFCVINHFAKYHMRVIQSTATDSASPSTNIASVRPLLQRYVSAVPLPQKLPEGEQCLSL